MTFKKIADKSWSVISNRWTLNILVWLFILDGVYNPRADDIYRLENGKHCFAALLMHLTWFVLIYSNTSFLIPRLLLSKKYAAYFLSIFIQSLLFTLWIGWYSEWLIKTFPVQHKNFYFFITVPLERSFNSLLGYYSGVLFSAVLPTHVLFSLGRLVRDFFKERRRSELLEKQQLEAELLLLKAQVNPHFLFNVLNSIYSMSLKRSEQAPEMILKLSHLLRYMLYESQQEYVPLDKELQMLYAYIDLETMRLKDKLAIQMTVDLHPGGLYIAPALLLFFVENAVKHGLETLPAGGFVAIEVSKQTDTDRLHFKCVNNFDASRSAANVKQKDSGIGLRNVSKRLELIYPGMHQLNIENSCNIFAVDLYLKTYTHDLPDYRR
ncbi:MAG: hypothetical protein EOP54_07600 [Sphingobacteriales bacterium]|nr:MAG: hypothetical protein EOP54_07600 [Sphingobacteriales bacterium]